MKPVGAACVVLAALVGMGCVTTTIERTAIPGQAAQPSYLQRLSKVESAARGEDLFGQLARSTDAQRAQLVRARYLQLDELALLSSQVGDEKRTSEVLAILSRATARAPSGEGAELFPADFRLADAVDTIVERARDNSIVLINESHHQPLHRAFAQRVAIELHKIGYRYLAVETLTNDGRQLPITGITRQTGYYSQEPVYAEFLRTAVGLGFELIPYESIPDSKLPPPAQLAAREAGQAKNIFDRTLARDRAAKVLVYAGYAHIKKTPGSGQGRQMASYLAEMAGTNPLSIDQTTLMAHPAGHPRLAAYDQLARKLQSGSPVVVLDSSDKPLVRGHYMGAVDLQVAHPPGRDYDGRPGWYKILANRHSMEVPRDLWPKSKRRLVQVFRLGDNVSSIPVDMLLLSPGAPSQRLMVPNGEFYLAFEDWPDEAEDRPSPAGLGF